MKISFRTIARTSGAAFTLAIPLLGGCGSSSSDDALVAGRSMVVEVGDGVTDLRLGDENDGEEDIEGESDSTVSSTEIQKCKDLFGEGTEGWKIAGSENQVSLEATEAFAVKITGNSNSLDLTIKAKEGETGLVNFPGACFVLGGNQPQLSVTVIGVAVEKLKIVAKGNSGKIDFKLKDGSTLPAGIEDDVGKHATMTITEEESTTAVQE